MSVAFITRPYNSSLFFFLRLDGHVQKHAPGALLESSQFLRGLALALTADLTVIGYLLAFLKDILDRPSIFINNHLIIPGSTS